MRRKSGSSSFYCFLIVAFTIAAVAARSQEDAGVAWDAFVAAYIETGFAFSPTTAAAEGRHEFDGQLPDWSRAGLERHAAWLRESRKRAASFDANTLSAERQFAREYVLSGIEGSLFHLETLRLPHTSPGYYAWALDPELYLTRDYAPLEQRMRAYIRWAEAIPAAVESIQGNLETPLPASFIAVGRISFGGLADFCQNDVAPVFAKVDNPDLQAELARANVAAVTALRTLDQWLKSLEAIATDDFALGPERFSGLLRATEGVDMPLAQLKTAGEADLARNLEALRLACAEFDPSKSVEECVALVQARKPSDGPVSAATRQLVELKAFLTEKDLVTIPGLEVARVAESPPYMRWNLAYISTPGVFETHLPATYYIAPPDPAWTPAEQAEYLPGEADLLAVSVHEVWPGHFLQFMHSNRNESLFARLHVGYAFSEGWAHYAEELMIEAGLGGGDPEVRIGQLLNALLRNARYLSAIGLHTEGMTVAESEQLFREKAFQDPGNARQQAARGTFDPAYINYTLGKLMIRKLREDWCATRGGRAAWKAFHDTFLSYGGPPIPLIRKAMLGPDAGPAL